MFARNAVAAARNTFVRTLASASPTGTAFSDVRNAPPTPAAKSRDNQLRQSFRKVDTPEDIWAKRSDYAVNNLMEPPTPYAGRTIAVDNGNFGNAYAHLTRIVRDNNIFRELRMAFRHEKKGDKRRRLRSERWRRLFAHEVRRKVQLVQAIVRRGA